MDLVCISIAIGFTPLEPRDARGVWRRHASSEMAERRRGKQRPLEPVVASPRPAVRVKTEEDLPARDRERLSELCAAAVGLLWLALLLAAGRSPAEKKCRPFSVVLLLLLTMTSFPVGSTTLEAALASDSINGCFSDSSPCGNCYDPSGASCSCTGGVNFYNDGLTGTIPAELSACTGITGL